MFSSFIQNIKNHISGLKKAENEITTLPNLSANTNTDFITRDCVIYIRVSSNEQNVDAQKYACEEYCFNNRLYIKGVHTEKISAFKGSKQKELQDLLNTYSNVNLIVFSIDRFSRSSVNAESYINIMNAKNINLISVKDKINLNTAFGKHEFRKLISIAQYESELISERVKNSVKYRKENGIHMGKVPYGYSKFNKKLVKDNEEQTVIKFIVRNSKKDSTPAKITKELYSLMKKLNREDIAPILFTVEDEEFEYRQIKDNEKVKISFSTICQILNDYNILNKGKKWTVGSVNRLFKKTIEEFGADFRNLRV
jgi:DNA invertase Pin-like site-specific DNA recombinase